MATPGDEGIELPNGRFAVPVRRGDLPSESFGQENLALLQRVLSQRAAKYAEARSASIITLRTGATAIAWSGEPLLTPVADYIVIPRSAVSLEVNAGAFVYVSWDRVLRELPDGLERIQRNPPQYYFTALAETDVRWRRLIDESSPAEQLRG